VRRLIVNPGTDSAWEIPLPTGIATLGREAGNDFVIEHPSVSSHHCEFMVMDSGVIIKDLGSSNGTFVDGQPVSESALLPGQRLQLGEVQLQLAQITAAAPTVTVTSNARCKYHPHNPARYLCPKCRINFCEQCVNIRASGGQSKHYCRTCAVECAPLTPAATTDEAAEVSFTRQIMGAFKYPLKGDGLILIAVGTFMLLLLDGAALLARYALIYGFTARIILMVTATGYLVAYMRHILNASAQGEEEMPGWPEINGFYDDIVLPFLQFVATVLVSFAPAIGLTIYAVSQAFGNADAGDTMWLGWATTAAIVLGCVYLPMAFTTVAMFDSVAALNPLLIIPSIAKVPKEYVLTVVFLGLMLILNWLQQNYLRTLVPVSLVAAILSGLLQLYLMIVEVRILGLLYRNKKNELGWFT